LAKHEENWDEWCKDLAPSKVLFKEFMHDKKIDWNENESKFRIKIKNNPKPSNALNALRTLIKDKTVTILCHCSDENRYHS
jgi:uncharacterized protein YeaO (DUF488 family)